MRVSSQKRTYEVETEADVSARFQSWSETDLAKVSPFDLRRIELNSQAASSHPVLIRLVVTLDWWGLPFRSSPVGCGRLDLATFGAASGPKSRPGLIFGQRFGSR